MSSAMTELRETRASCCSSQTWSFSTSSLERACRAARLASALCPRTALTLRIGERVIGNIAVDLEGAAEAGEMAHGVLTAATRRIEIGHRRWVGAAPWSIIACDGPQVAGFGAAAPRIEHRTSRFVGEQLARRLQDRDEPVVDGPELEGREPHPVCQRRAIDLD